MHLIVGQQVNKSRTDNINIVEHGKKAKQQNETHMHNINRKRLFIIMQILYHSANLSISKIFRSLFLPIRLILYLFHFHSLEFKSNPSIENLKLL